MLDAHPPSIAATHAHRREHFMILANMCRFALIEARRLVLTGTSPSPLQRLVGTAERLLDDLDELLVPLSPRRDAGEFALAASLHRALDELTILRREASAMPPSHKPLGAHDRMSPRPAW